MLQWTTVYNCCIALPSGAPEGRWMGPVTSSRYRIIVIINGTAIRYKHVTNHVTKYSSGCGWSTLLGFSHAAKGQHKL